jgi:hypothetical protein
MILMQLSELPDQQLTDEFQMFSKRYRHPIWKPIGLHEASLEFFGLREDSTFRASNPGVQAIIHVVPFLAHQVLSRPVAASRNSGAFVVQDDVSLYSPRRPTTM